MSDPTPAAMIAEGVRLTQDYYANPTCNVRRFDAEHWLVMHGHALLAIASAAEKFFESSWHLESCPAWSEPDDCDCGYEAIRDGLRRLAPTTKETDR